MTCFPRPAPAALPFLLVSPFGFGFVNFSLGAALVFCAFGLRLTLAARPSGFGKGLLFALVGGVLWLFHAYAWANARRARRRERGALPVDAARSTG